MTRWFVWMLLWGAATSLHAAPACRVLDPELAVEYQGECNSAGFAEGKGIARGTAEYAGEFKAGRKHGQGVKQWSWGDRYIGQFSEDRKEGYGLYLWGAQTPTAGDFYIGQYANDRRHGQGVYQWTSGERYDGVWDNDRMRGTPTPMAFQRGRYYAALRDSVLKAGAIVCRQIALGLGTKQRVRAVVIEASPETLSFVVKVDQALPVPIDGKQIPAGGIFRASAIEWEPCQ